VFQTGTNDFGSKERGSGTATSSLGDGLENQYCLALARKFKRNHVSETDSAHAIGNTVLDGLELG
jgi:hypothetical protein